MNDLFQQSHSQALGTSTVPRFPSLHIFETLERNCIFSQMVAP